VPLGRGIAGPPSIGFSRNWFGYSPAQLWHF